MTVEAASSGDDAQACVRLDDQLCFAVFTASAALVRAYRPLLGELGLSYQQYVALMVLWEGDVVAVGTLAGRLRLPLNGVSPVLDRLEDAGLLERRRGWPDRRVIQVALTEAGRALEARAAHVRDEVRCRTGLEPDTVAQLRDQLHALTTALTQTSPPP